MKTLALISSLLPLLLYSQGRKSEDLINEGLKKYDIESARIEYKVSGEAEGEEVFIYDRFGWRSLKKREMNFELYKIESTQKQHEITDGKLVYRINHDDSTYLKRMDIRWSSLAKQMNPEQVSESILFSLGGSYHSDSTLLDKTCKVWKFENRSLQEMWTWQGLVMKRISKLGDKLIVTTATSIETNIEVNEDQFVIPSHYTMKQ